MTGSSPSSSTLGPSTSESRRSAESLLATLRAAQKQIDTLAYTHLPLERAISFERSRRSGSLEEDLLSLVGEILDREVGIWRRSFAARAVAREADGLAAPAVSLGFEADPRGLARLQRSGASMPLADAPTREPIVRPPHASPELDPAPAEAAPVHALPPREATAVPGRDALLQPAIFAEAARAAEPPAEDFFRDEDDTLTDRDKMRSDEDFEAADDEDEEIAWVVEGREAPGHEEGAHISMQALAPPVDEDLFLRDSFAIDQAERDAASRSSAEEDIESLVLQELERAQAESLAESAATAPFEPSPAPGLDEGLPPADDRLADGLAGDDLVSDDLVSDDLVSDDLVSDDLVSDDLVSDDLVADGLAGDALVADDLVSDDLVADDLMADDLVLVSDGLVAEGPMGGDFAADKLPNEDLIRDDEDDLVGEPSEEDEVIEADDDPVQDDGSSLYDLDDLVMDGPTALSQEDADIPADRLGDRIVPRVETLFDDPEGLGDDPAASSVSDDLVLEEDDEGEEIEDEELRPEVDAASHALAGELMFARNPFLEEGAAGEEVIGIDLVPLGAASAGLGAPEPSPQPSPALDAVEPAEESLEEATVVIHSLTVVPRDPPPAAAAPLGKPPTDPESEPTVAFSSPFPSEEAYYGETEDSDTAPSRGAAVQLMSDGKARTLGHTLELEAAEDAEDAAASLGLPAGDGGHLSISFEEEFDEEPPIPMLTETAEPMRLHGEAPIRQEIPPQEIARRLTEARQIEERGDMQRASLLYSDVIDLDPRSLDARMGRGRCLMELGDYAAAMSDFQHAEDLDPNSARPAFEMGNLFYARKDYRRAIDFYTHAVEQDANLALARVRRGMSHYYRREYQQALQDLERARTMDAGIPGLESSINKVIRAMEGRD